MDDLLSALHREFGLAGFFASDNLRSERRRALLDCARRHVRRGMWGTGSGLPGLMRLGLDAVERALGADLLSDHMHLAHVHLLSAQELLRTIGRERLLGPDPLRRATSAPR